MADAKSKGSNVPDLAPAHPPKMGRGRTGTPISEAELAAWVERLNDAENYPEGVENPNSVYQKRGAATSRAQRYKKALMEYAELTPKSDTKIRTRVWEEDGKKDGAGKWHFGLQLVPNDPAEAESEEAASE